MVPSQGSKLLNLLLLLQSQVLPVCHYYRLILVAANCWCVAYSTFQSLEAIWDNKSPISVLPRVNGTGRTAQHQRLSSSSNVSHLVDDASKINHQPISHGITQTGVRTLHEIESEMRAAAEQSRNAAKRQQELQLQEQQEFELQELLQQQLLRKQQQQQQQLQMHQRTPPPRMLPVSQSPRFHNHQRQILLQQQQQQLRLQELQELRQAEEERLLLAQQQFMQLGQRPNHINQPPRPAMTDMQATHRRQQSPSFTDPRSQVPQQSMPHHSQGAQISQQLMAEMAQRELLRKMHDENGSVQMEAIRKIVETERMEEKRRRKAAKIAHMVRLFI